MRSETLCAKRILEQEKLSCVLCNGNDKDTVRSSARGIRPLLEFIETGGYKGYCAADRIVGKAAAMLYVILGVSEVYADVMSEQGMNMLKKHDIDCECGLLVKEIRNRQDTGICPMDAAVFSISDPMEAVQILRSKISGKI